MNFSKNITIWYKNNYRKFPWRKTKNPYYVLVSEFMLQQTKASQVVKYYLNFIQEFPNLEKLAEAEEKEVLKKWEGLGYYTRARNLHLFAKRLKKNQGFFFPSKYKDLIKYKGIGPYTGAAVASICFDEVVPAMGCFQSIHHGFRFYFMYSKKSKVFIMYRKKFLFFI